MSFATHKMLGRDNCNNRVVPLAPMTMAPTTMAPMTMAPMTMKPATPLPARVAGRAIAPWVMTDKPFLALQAEPAEDVEACVRSGNGAVCRLTRSHDSTESAAPARAATTSNACAAFGYGRSLGFAAAPAALQPVKEAVKPVSAVNGMGMETAETAEQQCSPAELARSMSADYKKTVHALQVSHQRHEARATERHDALAGQLDATQGSVESIMRESAMQRSELRQAHAQMQALKDKCQALESKLCGLNHVNPETGKIFDALREQKAAIETMSKQLFDVQSNVDRNASRVGLEHKQRIEDLHVGSLEHKQRIEDLHVGSLDHKQRIEDLHVGSLDHKRRIEDLHVGSLDHKRRIEELHAGSRRHHDDLKSVHRTASDAQKQVDSLSSSVRRHDGKVRDLGEECSKLRGDCSAMRTGLLDQKTSLERLDQRVSAQAKQVSALHDMYGSTNGQRDSLERMSSRMHTIEENSRSMHADAKKYQDDISRDVSRLTAQMSLSDQRHDALRSGLMQQRQAIEDLGRSVSALNESLRLNTERVDSLLKHDIAQRPRLTSEELAARAAPRRL